MGSAGCILKQLPHLTMMGNMKTIVRFMICLFLPIFVTVFSACFGSNRSSENEGNIETMTGGILSRIGESQVTYILPTPKTDGIVSVETALANRRSQRNFQNRAISAEQLSQILWAAYGITLPSAVPQLRGGLRTAPSAGALFPLEVFAIVGNVEGIAPGVYRYIPDGHKIVRVVDRDVRNELMEAALGQRMVGAAPASVFYSAVFGRATGRYGERGVRYVYIELGHSAQNVYLQAEALGLGTVAIGAFIDSRVSQILGLPANETPLYIMPIGYYYND